jgi:hypothetical protein
VEDERNGQANHDWWAMAERLASFAEGATSFELSAKARLVLIEMIVDLVVLLTSWPGPARPADPLAYLRARRARMTRHTSWLYALPPTARRLLLGTARLPSLLTYVAGDRSVDDGLRKLWCDALGSRHTSRQRRK